MRHWKLIVGAISSSCSLLGAAAALALNSLGETAAGDVRPGPATSGASKVVMRDNVFELTTVSVAAGTPVEIEIQNSGQASHNFTSEALNVSTGPMQAGDVKTVSVTVPSERTQFICTWHQGMVIDVVAS